MTRVPFVDLSRFTRALDPMTPSVLEETFGEIVGSAQFIGGPHVARLEAAIAQRLGVEHVVACANGTDALTLSLLALGVKPGDVVALPALTFWATYEAVVNVGARPLLIDIDPDDLQMSRTAIVRAFDEHRFSCAVLPHLFGWASGQLRDVRDACVSRGILLLEDAAQSFGVALSDSVHMSGVDHRGAPMAETVIARTPLLSGATMATLSFYPTKVIGGCMDGGAVVCRSTADAATVRSLANHGRSAAGGYLHERVGVNSRMSAIGAAYLLRVLAMADRILDDRRASLARYVEALDGRSGLRVHGPPPGVTGNGYLAVVTSERRDGVALATSLEARGVGWARTYPVCIADQEPARGALQWGDLREARAFCRRVVNPPLYFGLREDEQARAIDALLEGA